MIHGKNKNSIIFFISCCVATMLVIYRGQILNGFTFISGDSYDYVISSSILEHWYNVFKGLSHWAETNYYYPYKNTIAQTDAYFIVAIFYSVFRFIGIEPFLASELSSVTLKFVGFISIFFFLRKIFHIPVGWALLGSILFTINNAMVSHNSRLQLATVALAPLLSYLIYKTINNLLINNNKLFRWYGISFGIMYGAWCLTCFYMAWFWTYFVLVFSSLFVIFNYKDVIYGLSKIKIDRNKLISIFVVFVTFILSIIPFLYVFYPKSQEVKLRTYDMVLNNTIPVYDALQLGINNYLFGSVYNKILLFINPQYTISSEYYNTGVSPILFLLFLFSSAYIFKNRKTSVVGKVIFILFLTTSITWLSVMNFFGHSLWFFVYTIVPGAKAFNAVSTYQIFLAFPIVVIAVNFLSVLKIKNIYLFLIAMLAIASELSAQHLVFNRQEEIEKVTVATAPPSDCQAFYILGWSPDKISKTFPDWVNNMYSHNVTAMMIAELVNLPTVNGIASFNMPDWNFASPEFSNYPERIHEYAKNHNVKNLCSYNPNTKQWKLD
ncbi:hypothetical protein V2A84_11430 [Yersinia sp. 2553 StPb PI]|uniref:hypothetical protein n=1 Tax=Yersinia sp. 2553 StPb PI TaxID=3117411 RepID=UPI003FA46D82